MSGMDRKAFGQRLREARVRLGLTEQEAAKAAGRSVATWRLYEETGNGHVTRPALEFYSKYRVALREHHIDLDWLVAGDGQPLPPH